MNELYLGLNLNRARDGQRLVLDGREGKNPNADRHAPQGVYQITRTSGKAPGDVAYYGIKGE